MKTETVICDACKERISKRKCYFCEKDLCDECTYFIVLKRFYPNTISFKFYKKQYGVTRRDISKKIVLCKDCIYKLDTEWTKEKLRENITQKFFEIFKKEILIDAL